MILKDFETIAALKYGRYLGRQQNVQLHLRNERYTLKKAPKREQNHTQMS